MPRELARHLVERLLEVLLPEELGVRQPRADHLLVAGDDLRAAVLGDEVRHQQELVGELADRGSRSEKHFWCCFIDIIRHFGRHFQERLVEACPSAPSATR